ncbi:MAG: carboxylesterase family protein [Succinivibrio sp.]|nr:carboxylesterase family protein [Succinivibrio sp.]
MKIKHLVSPLVLSSFILSLSVVSPVYAQDEVVISNSAVTNEQEEQAPVVTTNIGTYEGLNLNDVEVFKGIPFAKEPSGSLRFAPPQAVEPFAGTYKATKFCPIPTQVSTLRDDKNDVQGTNTLCINIYRPKNVKADAKLPVYFWIFGGAYVAGTSNHPWYDGTEFAKDGVILVSTNYRVNAQGFLSSKAQFSKYGTTGNNGLLDMIESLKFVKNNIAAFGGDPDNITIGGESAGSFSVSALVLSPLTKGLFKNAIMESGTILSFPFISLDATHNRALAYDLSERFLNKFGLSDSSEAIETLETIDPVLLAHQSNYDYDFVTGRFSFLIPNCDGYVIPFDPVKELKEQNFNKVNILMGYNTDEGTYFANPKITNEEYQMALDNNFGDKSDAIKAIYEGFDAPFKKTYELLGDVMFNIGVKVFADNLAETNDVYMYHFDYASDKESPYGVTHASEIQYAFKTLDSKAKEQDTKVADTTHKLWVNFIKTGNPNYDGEHFIDKAWLKYKKGSALVYRIGEECSVEPFAIKERLEKLGKLLVQ